VILNQTTIHFVGLPEDDEDRSDDDGETIQRLLRHDIPSTKPTTTSTASTKSITPNESNNNTNIRTSRTLSMENEADLFDDDEDDKENHQQPEPPPTGIEIMLPYLTTDIIPCRHAWVLAIRNIANF
jgi:hypothetical protein